MKVMQVNKAALVILLAMSLVVAGCARPAPVEKPKKDVGTIRVGYLPATHDTHFFIAMEKGFFEEEGLKVEAFAFKSSGEILEAMKAKKVDVGIPGVAAPVFFISQGADFKIVGGAAWYSAAVVAKPERVQEFKKMEGFRGKTVATVRLATGDVTWRWGLKQAGLDLAKDVTIREFGSPGDAMAAVAAGHVDAGVLWEPFVTVAEKQGLQIVSWTKEIYPHPCCRQVATAEFAKSNPDALIAYLKGLIKAERFFRDPKNKSEVLAIAVKWLKLEEDLLQRTLIDIEPAIGDTRTTVSPRIGTEEVEKYIDMMAGIGYITAEGATRAKAAIEEQYIIKAYLDLGLAKNEAEARKLAGARAK